MRSPWNGKHKTQRWFCLASKGDTVPVAQCRVDILFVDSKVADAIQCFNLEGNCFFIFEAASNA